MKTVLHAIPALVVLSQVAMYGAEVGQWGVFETSFESAKTYAKPFVDVEVNVVFTAIYDYTTWKEGMNCPGSTQLGIGKRLLEQYPWARFQPHPEWVEAGCFAAGIPGEVRFIYLPRRGVYNWSGITVKNLERDATYHAFYFNPTNGKRYDHGKLTVAGDWKSPAIPSPQDWVLVLERVKP